jgi:hypothetical protein
MQQRSWMANHPNPIYSSYTALETPVIHDSHTLQVSPVRMELGRPLMFH